METAGEGETEGLTEPVKQPRATNDMSTETGQDRHKKEKTNEKQETIQPAMCVTGGSKKRGDSRARMQQQNNRKQQKPFLERK